jgi:hypothetical protein
MQLTAQKNLSWHLRLGYSPFTEDKIGIGAAYYPNNSHWFHQLEIYPIQNRASSIVTNAQNFGFLLQTNYSLAQSKKNPVFFLGAQVYGYNYSRQLINLPEQVETDAVAQLMLQAGIKFRINKRIQLGVSLPFMGTELVNSNGSAGTDFHATPLLLFVYGFVQPKLGIDIALF